MTLKEICEEMEKALNDFESGKRSGNALYEIMVDAQAALSLIGETPKKKRMRVKIEINDETIAEDIRFEMQNLLECGKLDVMTSKEIDELADECLDTILTRCEFDADYFPTWEEIRGTVHNAAAEHGYLY